MHILIIHQAFASLDEPGGTRHYEFARLLVGRGYQVTVIASPVSYITGAPSPLGASDANRAQGPGTLTILRASVYAAHHRSFPHRVLAFFSFMFSSFWIGLGVRNVDLVWGTSPPIFQGATAWALARLKGVRFLFEVRDLWPQFAIAVGVLKDPLLISASEWLERFLYRQADQVLVNSPGFIAHVRDRGAKLVDLVPNGADPSMFDPADDGAAFRHANQLEDKFVALYAGAHGLSNDLDVVLDCRRADEGSACSNRARGGWQGETGLAKAGSRAWPSEYYVRTIRTEKRHAWNPCRGGCLYRNPQAAGRIQDYLSQ